MQNTPSWRRGGPSPDAESVGALALELPASRPVRNKLLFPDSFSYFASVVVASIDPLPCSVRVCMASAQVHTQRPEEDIRHPVPALSSFGVTLRWDLSLNLELSSSQHDPVILLSQPSTVLRLQVYVATLSLPLGVVDSVQVLYL